MEIEKTKFGKVIRMSFVDAEHCGMKLDDLEGELGMHGINIDWKKEGDVPIALVIQLEGGFIINGAKPIQEKFLSRRIRARDKFNKLMARILE
jgi:hypothetical protein